MPDVGSSSFNEVDANNSNASPDGFPTGMSPSGVDNSARAVMGAVKRAWKHINPVLTTGGTSSAYTLAYDQTPTAYYDGEIISFVVNAANAAAATLNVNALGAIPLRLFGGNLLRGALAADQIVQARYNTAAGAFDILRTQGWTVIGSAAPSNTNITFSGIPAGVNNLMLTIEVVPTLDASTIFIQTAGADGNDDLGASDYSYIAIYANSGGAAPATVPDTANGWVPLNVVSDIDNGTFGFQSTVHFNNIQAATFTKCSYQSTYLDSAGSLIVTVDGKGMRREADRITGVAVSGTPGQFTGRLTLYGSV